MLKSPALVHRFDEVESERLKKMLETFDTLLEDACSLAGLSPRHTPFVRASHLAVILNPDAVHVIVDDMRSIGFHDHHYVDSREAPNTLDFFIDVARKEYAFESPLGVTLPVEALSASEEERRAILQPIATKLCSDLQERAKTRSLALPVGFEHYSRYMPEFLKDHPDADKNVFLMMRFRPGQQYDEIHSAVRSAMQQFGLTVLRADDKDYTGDLWDNVCLYMLGCRFGVAVFEEIDLREFNPNVALELGFMMALGKKCLLLKDQRMQRMPTDIVGKLYHEFDSYNIAASITPAVEKWSQDLGFVANGGDGRSHV